MSPYSNYYPCTIEGCAKPILARGWCSKHYARWHANGDPLVTPFRTPEQRFWSHVDPCRTDGCALWLAQTVLGYGRFKVGGRTIQAHHFLVGKAPEGLEWDHVKARGCVHRNCVWPDHLEMVSHQENVSRGDAPFATRVRHAAKTHCPRGHAYDEANTGRNKAGGRWCRRCDRERLPSH